MNLINASRIINYLRKGGGKVICKYKRIVLKNQCSRKQSYKETGDTRITTFDITQS